MRRLAPVLIAFLFALAATLPVGVRAMPTVGATGMTRHCPICPHPAPTGTAPDRMHMCPAPSCAAAVAVLPLPARLSGRVVLAAIPPLPPARAWTGALLAPDPLPPRPIALL
jgi:hypothetical protein